ncbi:MAG: hypothetical protein RDV41_14735, partial [Planctomycetota bacterium]|nr:hypothetical protein [Planctomycetota bacterium]
MRLGRFLSGITALCAFFCLQATGFGQQAEEEKTLKVLLKRDGQCISDKSFIQGDAEQWAVR